ncbi:MAG: TetR/AcrR family transcriptional regulator [Eubacterium sp.]|nr:TetR/AcrR family transcriptional regulator [Eubacterium sp.]
MTNEMLDERYHVAEEAIQDAFFLLTKEKPFDKITVSDVIKRAGIVRSTFYNHYQNVPQLINAIEDQTIDNIFSLMETFHPKNDREICRNYFMTLCRYTMTNPFLSELLRSARGEQFLKKALTMFHRYVAGITENASISHQSKEKRSFTIAFVIGGTVGILHKWSHEDFQTPLEVVADILTETFMAGMLPLMS